MSNPEAPTTDSNGNPDNEKRTIYPGFYVDKILKGLTGYNCCSDNGGAVSGNKSVRSNVAHKICVVHAAV